MASPVQRENAGKYILIVKTLWRATYFPVDPTLRDVCDELGEMRHKWFEIGIQLSIPRNTLKQFKNEDDPLSAAVDYWLKGNVVDSAVPVSWKSIITALKSKHVGEPALAEEIKKKYCQQDTTIVKGWDYRFKIE